MAFVWKDKMAFTLHLFAGLVCVFWIQRLCSFTEQRLLNYYLKEGKDILLSISLSLVSFLKPLLKHQVGNGDGEGNVSIKLER